MEQNLITVDLDKNLIIPIKEPFNKKQLAHFVADYFDYEKGEEKVEHKLFEGTFEQFQQFATGKDNLQVIQINNGSVNYQEKNIMPYTITKMEFGIEKWLKPSTDALIDMLTKAQIEQAEAQIAEAQKQLEDNKKLIEQGFQSIRDVTLSQE